MFIILIITLLLLVIAACKAAQPCSKCQANNFCMTKTKTYTTMYGPVKAIDGKDIIIKNNGNCITIIRRDN
jgi:hypothetical protein